MPRVVVAMSGGVDSSVAAHLLVAAGHEVVGLFMRHGAASPVACESPQEQVASQLPIARRPSAHRQGCCSAADAEDARSVADRLGIPFYAIDFQQEFDRIIDYFVDEYLSARTPNPCVVCNQVIKFGKLFDYADGIGAEFVATGHYARLITSPRPRSPYAPAAGAALCRGVDRAKDQSYALFGIPRHRLARIQLPVGTFRKAQIRHMAQSLGLAVATKRDSQEICFVPSGRHDALVRQRRGPAVTSGEIVDTQGVVLGRHAGIERFTVGQRKGLGIALGERRFVVRIEADTKRVVIGERCELAVQSLTAVRPNWLVDRPKGPFRCQAQIRYNSPAHPARCQWDADNRLRVVFDEPRLGVSPGQAVVCYAGDRVLGGAWIESTGGAHGRSAASSASRG